MLFGNKENFNLCHLYKYPFSNPSVQSLTLREKMASCRVLVFAALLLVLLPIAAKADLKDLSPALSPFYEKLCDEVECGKGTCKADISYPLNYICECDSGWKRTRYDNDTDDDHKFLPCVIPNCTLDYSCQPAPPPVPAKEVPLNLSFFDPCYWTYCGDGTCNRTSTYKHLCQCNSGYFNLLNKTYFPCYSQSSTFLPGKLHWAAILVMSMAMVLWK
ncbi:hypothetical protein PTKIN_Ptkin01aG0337700 [Pterospermum kingtungense]